MKTTKTVAAALVALSAPAFANFQGLVDRYEDVKVAASVGESISNAAGGVTNALTVSDGLPPMLSEGTREFGITGNINFADDIAYNMNVTYGWFIKDRWEVGFGLGVQGVESDANFSLGLFTEYNFMISETSKWVPYVGFFVSWASLSSDVLDADSIALGRNLGMKYFVRENIAISMSIGAQFAFDDVFPGEDDFQRQINIGTRF
ncbi:hypothetical protein N9062_02005 [Akkermansiaceae bacterium]|nr:hypothetical protein [Akkermansiaceae bacterium]MDB4383609.1 hypothetical protein [Akkermansiaceae bacterium]MDB4466395.1 hypothetical protein [bacterium]MDB4509756.1 hypothetical protein [Akkermansiaceae bacterium]